MGAATPLRELGARTPEGWILVRDIESTYDDGVEDYLLSVFESESDLRSTNSNLVSHARGRAESFQVDPARANIIRGLDIPTGARVLEIGAGLGAITRFLGERADLVDAVEPATARARCARARTRDLPGVEVFVGDHTDVPDVPTYDVIVVVGVLEYVGGGSADPEPYISFLSWLGRCLLPGGTIALAIENKLGVKYLVGAPEDHTDRIFDSIETYPQKGHARTFSRRELEALFVAAGLNPSTRIAFPDYKVTRAVLDADVLGEEAPALLREVPVFPSPDLRSDRPRLADEGRVWRSFVDAGLAAETGNSFLVLAGRGEPQSLWPADLAGVFYSQSRRENYAFEKRIVRTEPGLVISRRRVGRDDSTALLRSTEDVEPVVDGQTLQEAAAGLSIPEAAVLLVPWKVELETRARDVDDMPFDFVPNNIIVRADGTLEPIDQEWTAPGWSLDRVVRRGVLWFAAQLVRSSAPTQWSEFTSVRDVAVELGTALGLDPIGEWVHQAVTEEAEFRAEVGILQYGEDLLAAAERIAGDLISMLDDPLVELPLGDRLPDLFAKVQHYLRVSEQSVEHLVGERDGLLDSARRAREDRAEAVTAALAAQTAARAAALRASSAEVMQAVLNERLSTAEGRVNTESARAGAAENALAAIRAGRAFRAAGMYTRLLNKVTPVNSRRRRLHDQTARLALRGLRRLRPVVQPPPVSIVVPTSSQPVVSIVIPVHGKWDYTERCLVALAATAGDIAYEVIVVDDASPDDTAERLRLVQGVRAVSLAQNLGFVGACNAGIEETHGEFVVLLNNDTRVHPLWLIPLLETIADPGVGLVGSRLIYPDGRLQEAGGIIFSDGSGWNYGKFADPEDPAYTYRRDVDYCSGASIILRKSTLNELGNLDARYSPAYYDDADLAFGVRELGLRVVYEPRSLVVHDEGISHGTDESSGTKAYQAVNKEKFVVKWQHRLVEQCAPDAANVPFAARRRNGERIVVVIDHYVPRPDEDSGSVRMMGMLRTLRELGYGVLFVPDNRFRSEPWTGLLGELGVEVFYGQGDLPGRLRELSEHIHTVVVSRVTVAWTYAFMLRTVLPGIPVVFDTVDLHFLREQRAAVLGGTEELSPRAKTLKALELAIAQTADTTIVVSPYEQELLRVTLPGIDVKVVPNVHLPVIFPSTTDGRAGLLFVGSFAHHPNSDGLRWFFSEVLPLIEQHQPRVPVTIVGRNPDPDLVENSPANVSFLGWVEDLTPLYDSARIAIAPLRYGAGVKGKIGEAMTHGVPVVMTLVGAEGMALSHGETAWIAQDAQSFADGVVKLLSDDEYWHLLSKSGAAHIETTFGSARFAELLEEVLAHEVIAN